MNPEEIFNLKKDPYNCSLGWSFSEYVCKADGVDQRSECTSTLATKATLVVVKGALKFICHKLWMLQTNLILCIILACNAILKT